MTTETPTVTCPYCHAAIAPAAYIAHDIQVHAGLASMRDVHTLICEPGVICLCRLAEYEACAAGRA